jgi:hypothetical protein
MVTQRIVDARFIASKNFHVRICSQTFFIAIQELWLNLFMVSSLYDGVHVIFSNLLLHIIFGLFGSELILVVFQLLNLVIGDLIYFET